MRTIIVIVVILAIAAMLTVDGLGMYAAHRTAIEVAKGAADHAAQVFVATQGSEAAAERAVQGIAREADVQLVSADYHKAATRWYEVTVRSEPKSYFLKHLPYLKDHLAQQSTAVVHF
ncbi:MAG: hypothetical protein V1912_09510 [bacterium]